MNLSLRYKIIFLVLVPTTLVYFSVLFFSLFQSEKKNQLDIKNEMHQYTQYYALYYASFLREAMQIGHSSALLLQHNLQMSKSKIYNITKDNVELNPVVFGSAIAFDYDEEEGDELFFAPYSYRSNNEVYSIDIAQTTDYAKANWEWWDRAVLTKRGFWTSPYFSQSDKQNKQSEVSKELLMATYAVPILDENEFVGVTTIDIALNPLEQTVSKVLPSDVDFLILNKKGEYLYSKNSTDILTRSIFDDIERTQSAGLKRLASAMLGGKVGMIKVDNWNADKKNPYKSQLLNKNVMNDSQDNIQNKIEWVFYRSIPMTDWSLAVRIDESKILQQSRDEVLRLGMLMLISLTILIVVIWLVVGHITFPLARLTKNVREFSLGKQETITDMDRKDEIGLLARNFSEMIQRLHSEQTILEEKKEAERANKAKSVFLSNMTHELRTPLNGVLGYTQILQNNFENSQQQSENLDAIESCGNHLLSLINDVLDISKIERGYSDVVKTDFDLSEMLHDVYNIVLPRSKSKGLELDIDKESDCPKLIYSDKTKLKQILINLMGNAVKFTQQGSITLSINLVKDNNEYEELSFAVKDTGVGIELAEQKFIFDAFKQTDQGLDEGGTGLGLAISQHLAKELGYSSIKLTSTYGKGSIFEFKIPISTENISQKEWGDDELTPLSDNNNVIQTFTENPFSSDSSALERAQYPKLNEDLLLKFYRASQVGDLNELQQHLHTLSLLGDEYQPVYEQLKNWVNSFDFKKIEAFTHVSNLDAENKSH